MDDLISRQAVLEATSTTLKITGKENAETVYKYIKKLCDDIKALPSVDAVEVVRCKDCVNSDWYTTTDGRRLCYCMVHDNGGHKETDFCSDGERENDG